MQEIKFLTLEKKEREREEQNHNPASKALILNLLKICHQLHQLLIVTNYHFYHLWLDSGQNLKNKNWCKTLNLVIVTSNKLYFHNLHERFKCTGNKHRELNFCHKFYLFVQVWNAWVKYLTVASFNMNACWSNQYQKLLHFLKTGFITVYFSDMNCLKNPLLCSTPTQLITSDFSL